MEHSSNMSEGESLTNREIMVRTLAYATGRPESAIAGHRGDDDGKADRVGHRRQPTVGRKRPTPGTQGM
jgi:hypothetical protein